MSCVCSSPLGGCSSEWPILILITQDFAQGFARVSLRVSLGVSLRVSLRVSLGAPLYLNVPHNYNTQMNETEIILAIMH